MTNVTNKIIDRIRKLLELSNSTNEHEAAAAASAAARLMAEHQIEQAIIDATRPDEMAVPEDIIEENLEGTAGKRKLTGWRTILAHGVAGGLGLKSFTSGGRVIAMGPRSKTQAWNYTSLFLAREIDRLADEAWAGGPGELPRWNDVSPRRWKNAFRVGAARVVQSRLIKEYRERKATRGADIQKAALTAGQSEAAATAALAIIDRDAQRLDSAYEIRSKGFSRGTPIGATSSSSGYSAGRSAGASMDLGRGARGGLPAPKGQLR